MVAAEFYELRTESGRKVTLLGDHLIPLLDCSGPVPPSEILLKKSKFASRAKLGECLLGPEGLEKIKTIKIFESSGIYAPVTPSGGLLVDGLTASCYSYVESHTLQHMVFSVVNKFFDFYDFFHNFNQNSMQLEIPGFATFLIEAITSTSLISS